MQASNLQNLPENYTMRFCLYLSRLETAQAPLKDSHNRWAGIYHLMSWPQLSYVAEDHKGRIVGYVLSKMWARLNSSRIILSSSHLPLVGRDEPDEDNPEGETHGHVNSISVLREYRRLGIARKMMLLSRLCYRFGFSIVELKNTFLQKTLWKRSMEQPIVRSMFGSQIKQPSLYIKKLLVSKLQRSRKSIVSIFKNTWLSKMLTCKHII